MKQSGVIYVEALMSCYRRSQEDVERFNRMQWQYRIKNALWCYGKAQSREEKREVVKFYKEEFTRLGWKVTY